MGYKRILTFAPVMAQRVRIAAARLPPALAAIGLYRRAAGASGE